MAVFPEMSRKSTRSKSAKSGNTESKAIEIRRGFATVKIYPVQNRDKSLFMITWFVAGRRQRKNVSDEAAARKEAASVAEKLNRGQQQALERTGADRESYVVARTKLAPFGIPLHDAVTDYAAAMTLLGGPPLLGAIRFYLKHHRDRIPEKRVKDAYEEFLRQQRADNRSVRYIQEIRSRLGRFAESFKMNLVDVYTPMIDQWIRSLSISQPPIPSNSNSSIPRATLPPSWQTGIRNPL